jgi:hypothetical protein
MGQIRTQKTAFGSPEFEKPLQRSADSVALVPTITQLGDLSLLSLDNSD